ncbi:MAG TPA: CoA pyrophosphatase [Acidimicrobiales bacterium]|nr:CoA pyrophosphatase [Acidimicrobiales bacterium]
MDLQDLEELQHLQDRMRANLAAFPRQPVSHDGLRHAAVAATVVTGPAGAALLLTRRTAGLRAHPGQWALPGGSVDAGETPPEAALRELGEELGLQLPSSAVIGMLDDYRTRSGFSITPVVVWACRLEGPLHPNPAEVASVHRIPLSVLEGPDVPRLLTIPESDRPVIQMPLGPGRLIHAPTAAILYQVREVAVHGRWTRVAHFEQPTWAWG